MTLIEEQVWNSFEYVLKYLTPPSFPIRFDKESKMFFINPTHRIKAKTILSCIFLYALTYGLAFAWTSIVLLRSTHYKEKPSHKLIHIGCGTILYLYLIIAIIFVLDLLINRGACVYCMNAMRYFQLSTERKCNRILICNKYVNVVVF